MAISRFVVRFINKEVAGALSLLTITLLALFLANSTMAPLYQLYVVQPLQHAVNDGLMVLFFLLVGLEVKREIKQGELSTKAQALLPCAAAVGGMLVPVLVFLFIVQDHAALWRGWAIPAATDIAFALGIAALLGRYIPLSLKVFLMALAIIDDIGAVLIIGFFYSADINIAGLLGVLLICGLLYACNRTNQQRLAIYLALGILLWAAMMHAGLHGTLAGVLTALAVPVGNANLPRRSSPLRRLEHALHSWVIFGVMPIFALVNAGLVLKGLPLSDLTAPLPLGIMLGLFLGKQIGIFGASFLLIRLGYAALPAGASWAQLYGVAILGGIGFTMSQFIGGLALPDPAQANAIRLGVLSGSLLSALWGLLVLFSTSVLFVRNKA